MWMDITFSSPQPIRRISIHYGFYVHGNAQSVNILSQINGEWKNIAATVPFVIHPFEFVNNHPVYDGQFQTISFDPIVTDRLRIEIEDPREDRHWSIGEIEVHREIIKI